MPADGTVPRFWDKRVTIYFFSASGILLIVNIPFMIAKQVSLTFLFDYSIGIFAVRIIINFIALTIMLWIPILVWKKKRDETLRLLDASRNRRKFSITKYSGFIHIVHLVKLLLLFYFFQTFCNHPNNSVTCFSYELFFGKFLFAFELHFSEHSSC